MILKKYFIEQLTHITQKNVTLTYFAYLYTNVRGFTILINFVARNLPDCRWNVCLRSLDL